MEDGFQYVLPDELHTMDLGVAASDSDWSDDEDGQQPRESFQDCEARVNFHPGVTRPSWPLADFQKVAPYPDQVLPNIPGTMDTIPEHDHLQRWMCTRSSSSKDQQPDEDLAPHPDQELADQELAPSPDQEIEKVYDANWDAPPHGCHWLI